MGSAYVPPALRARQPPTDKPASSAGSGSSSRAGPSGYNGSGFASSSTYGSTGSDPNGSYGSYRQTTSYSAPGRPRLPPSSTTAGSEGYSVGSGISSSGRGGMNGTYPQPGAGSKQAGGEGTKPTPAATAYRTPAQRAQDKQDAESRRRDRDEWPTYDSSSRYGAASGSSSGRDDRYNASNSGGTRENGWNGGMNRASSGPGRARVNGSGAERSAGKGTIPVHSTSPSLYVFGDSFVGPMKLLSNESARCQTFKGASAKGLNNANSAKQVAKQLTPALNNLIAPEYGYIPKSGRWALLIFGNVDLQINYLWQLQHKPLTPASFPPGTTLPSHIIHTDGDSASDDNPTSAPRRKNHVLANATETSLSGHALGPMLFVEAVVRAYTSYLETQIVQGPIGIKLSAQAEKARAGSPDPKAVPGKVLVAAALPPLVQDEVLSRIPEKYVERLEDEHEKMQKALNVRSGPPKWRLAMDGEGADGKGGLEERMGGLGMRNEGARPGTPPSAASALSSGTGGSDGTSTTIMTDTDVEGCSTAPSSPPSTSSTSRPHKQAGREESAAAEIETATEVDADDGDDRYSIAYLLAHDPPLCTLPIRVQMTDRYNELLRTYVLTRPDVLEWVDISPSMRKADLDAITTSPPDLSIPKEHARTLARRTEANQGIVDRTTWACPVDPTNVHPLWEPTLPLWLEEMGKLGLPTDSWRLDEAADETFRAYEEDKRRRTEKREAEWAAEAAGAGAGR